MQYLAIDATIVTRRTFSAGVIVASTITTRPQPTVALDTQIVRRVDHIVICIAKPAYRHLQRLFTHSFQLPAKRRTAERSAYTADSIFAGNLGLRLLAADDSAMPTSAHFYGLVMETKTQDLSRLSARGISYIPAPYYMPHDEQASTLMHVNVLLNGYLGATPIMRALFAVNRLVPDQFWMRALAREVPERIQGADFLLNRLYRDGMVILVKHNPGWRQKEADERHCIADFIARGGGSLGLVSVREVVIGCTDIEAAHYRWHTLLNPAQEVEPSVWRLSQGPAIRLVKSHRNAIDRLVLEVESMDGAAQVLDDMELLGRKSPDELRIEAAKVGGLDFRLVQARL